MDAGSQPLFARLKLVLFIAWAIIALRFAIEFTEPEELFLLPGIYYVMPVLLALATWRGAFDGLSYGRFTLAVLLLAVLCWLLPNLVIYLTAKFMGWEHGRFNPGKLVGGSRVGERGPPVMDTLFGKLRAGTTVAALTTVAGFVWTFAFANLFVYVARPLLRRLRGGEAPAER